MEVNELEFASRLKKAIRESGKTQEEIARIIDVDPVTMSRWVTGARHPDAINLGKIAIVLQIGTDYLLFGDGEKKVDRGELEPASEARAAADYLYKKVVECEEKIKKLKEEVEEAKRANIRKTEVRN